MIYFTLAIGLIIGSFINVVIYRLPRGESVISPGSRCPNCEHRLKALDLIPIFSYAWLKGKCRYCRGPISFRYPLVEIITAISFILIYLEYGLIFYIISGWLLSAVLIASAVIDTNEGIIPDKITYSAIVIGLALSYFTVGVPSAIMGALLFGGVLLLTAVFSRGGMGGGDIKLALAIAAFTGLQGAFVAFVISSLLGGAAAISLLLGKQATLKTAVKFGPFLAVGGWLAFVYGNQLINFYLNILG